MVTVYYTGARPDERLTVTWLGMQRTHGGTVQAHERTVSGSTVIVVSDSGDTAVVTGTLAAEMWHAAGAIASAL